MRYLLIVLIGLVLGCGDDGVSSRQAARSELGSLGITYREAAFVDAAAVGNLAVVELFVVSGMSVNARVDGGSTALHRAASGGHLDVVEYLVGQGAVVNATDDFGYTVLHGRRFGIVCRWLSILLVVVRTWMLGMIVVGRRCIMRRVTMGRMVVIGSRLVLCRWLSF